MCCENGPSCRRKERLSRDCSQRSRANYWSCRTNWRSHDSINAHGQNKSQTSNQVVTPNDNATSSYVHVGELVPATSGRLIALNGGATSSIQHVGEIVPATGDCIVMRNGDATSSLTYVTKVALATDHVVVTWHHGATSPNQHLVKRNPHAWSRSCRGPWLCYISNCRANPCECGGKVYENSKMPQSQKKASEK